MFHHIRNLLHMYCYAADPYVLAQVVLMSATLDSDMFARYYGGCPVLTAGGRTFPVEQHFLEDAYELTGYVPGTFLVPGSACMH